MRYYSKESRLHNLRCFFSISLSLSFAFVFDAADGEKFMKFLLLAKKVLKRKAKKNLSTTSDDAIKNYYVPLWAGSFTSCRGEREAVKY